LADTDHATARAVRPYLLARGIELVHARAGIAALELLQRIPEDFALALISLQLPDIPGAVLVETLRIFRPGMPVVCLTDDPGPDAVESGACLVKPLQKLEINFQVSDALAGRTTPVEQAILEPDTIARAQASFALSSNLLDAARELTRGYRC
jgi:DNA-binding response OmpR family regulator